MRLHYWTLGLFALIFVVAGTAAATHYRYGTLSWEPTGNPNEVLFTGGQAWRASAFGNPNVGDLIQGEASLATGDSGSEAIYLKVTSKSVVNDYFTATFARADGSPGILHTYPSPNNGGAPWTASFASCCRISPHSSGNFHANNPDQSERLETKVDLAGTPNSSPKTNLPPINSCPRNALCSIVIPRADAEDDPIAFRLATAAEAGDPSYHIPGPPEATYSASVGSANGILTWNTTGATVSSDPDEHSLYSIQLMLEDGKTKTPVDFFLEIVPIGVHPPRWVKPPTPCGETLTVGALAPMTFDARAVSDDNRDVIMGNLGLPPGALMPMPAPSNPADATYTWTPLLSQVGTHLIVLTAEDDRGYAAPPCAITIKVVAKPYAIAGPDKCVKFGSTVTFDGSQSGYPSGSIVSWRWDFPHGPSPVFGPTVTRTLNTPADATPYDVTLTVTANDSQTATDTLRVSTYTALLVSPSSSAPRYTPFQRPHGEVDVGIPCGASIAGAALDIKIRYTTNDPALDTLLVDTLGAQALVWETSVTLDATGRARWDLPFSVAERYALPLGLLNPVSQVLLLDGDYVVEADAALEGITGHGESRFDVVLDHQFPLDDVPTAAPDAPEPAALAPRKEAIE